MSFDKIEFICLLLVLNLFYRIFFHEHATLKIKYS